MYHVSAQGIDERMINVHYYYYYYQGQALVNLVVFYGCRLRWVGSVTIHHHTAE